MAASLAFFSISIDNDYMERLDSPYRRSSPDLTSSLSRYRSDDLIIRNKMDRQTVADKSFEVNGVLFLHVKDTLCLEICDFLHNTRGS